MTDLDVLLIGPEATARAGEALGACLAAGDVVGLTGDLGAGKTHLVQGLARGLGVPSDTPVTSPTFALIQEIRGGRVPLHHADLYRLERARELDELGLDELIGGAGAVAIEWCDRFPVLPADAVRVHLAIAAGPAGEDARRLTATAGGPRSAVVLGAWRAALP